MNIQQKLPNIPLVIFLKVGLTFTRFLFFRPSRDKQKIIALPDNQSIFDVYTYDFYIKQLFVNHNDRYIA